MGPREKLCYEIARMDIAKLLHLGRRPKTGQPGNQEEVLALLAPMGLDWRATSDELASRFGVTGKDALGPFVALPPSTVLTSFPLVFTVRLDEQGRNHPAHYFTAAWNQRGNARANFSELEGELSQTLGPGRRTDVSNCLQREWLFGEVRATLRAWPPDLNRSTLNVLYAEDPRRAEEASFTIETERAYLFPDESLGQTLSPPTSRLDLSGERFHGICPATSRFASRLNPEAVRESLEESSVFAWKCTDLIGLSTKRLSLVFSRPAAQSLRLDRLTPGRFSGSSQLVLVDDSAHGTAIVNGSSTESCDELAKRLAYFWSLSIEETNFPDDG